MHFNDNWHTLTLLTPPSPRLSPSWGRGPGGGRYERGELRFYYQPLKNHIEAL